VCEVSRTARADQVRAVFVFGGMGRPCFPARWQGDTLQDISAIIKHYLKMTIYKKINNSGADECKFSVKIDR
jgi:hypothetical protein